MTVTAWFKTDLFWVAVADLRRPRVGCESGSAFGPRVDEGSVPLEALVAEQVQPVGVGLAHQ